MIDSMLVLLGCCPEPAAIIITITAAAAAAVAAAAHSAGPSGPLGLY